MSRSIKRIRKGARKLVKSLERRFSASKRRK